MTSTQEAPLGLEHAGKSTRVCQIVLAHMNSMISPLAKQETLKIVLVPYSLLDAV
jgi:hypothetical protein